MGLGAESRNLSFAMKGRVHVEHCVPRGAAVICLALCGALHAADKSGVSPNTISLPKGPGAIEGLGESFQPTLNTGTAKYAIALNLPPGTAGQQPSLTLLYEGGNANGPLGFGWQLSLPHVQRQSDHGVPTYGEYVGFERTDTFINDAKEQLVPLTNGWYFCKNESAFVRYQRNDLSWVGTAPDGKRLDFGLTDSGRIQDDTNHVFCWQLERETDTHGNTILYSYTNFPGIQNTNQKYLVEVRYGPGAPPWSNFHFVRLSYEDRPDWFEDCRAGFPVRTGKRLKSLVIGTQGPVLAGHQQGDFNEDGVTDNLVRRYDMEYLDYAGTNSHWSLLSSVQLVGADGVTALPPATFGYTVCDPPTNLFATGHILGGTNEPTLVMDKAYVDFVDLNGDGLPDVLRTGGPEHLAYLNRGEQLIGRERAVQWEGPVVVDAESGWAWNYSLDADSTHLADMDGDGLADLVHKSGPDIVFYFKNRGTIEWAASQTMSAETNPPPAPFGVSDVRTADVDFDKRTDLIRGDGLQYQVWFNFGRDRYSERVTIPNEAAFDFSLSAVQIADFNGDRLPDITWVQPSGVEVAAGLGYGRFSARLFVPLPDETLDSSQVEKSKLMDINGDGLADLVIERASSGELWFWLNLGNYSLSERKTITGMPTGVGLNPAIRWADMNGNGSTDLVYADSATEPRLQVVDIGEVLGCLPRPNTLCAISNGIGRVTLIDYEPSTKFALEDRAAGTPWPDPIPFPVSVVAGVTTGDSLGHSYRTEFRYHDGYYDPVEKQFRGFARVEQIDVGDPTAPTLVARSHFDTGRDYDSMKGKLLGLTAGQEDGNAFWTETNYWTIPPVNLYTGTNGTNVVYVHPTARTKLITELGHGTPRLVESEFAYDRYGNQTTNAEYGIVENGDRSAFDDERITVTEYAINTNAWLLRFPARQEIMDENGEVISRVESFYDDETFSGNNRGLATIGNLTMKREWIWPATNSAYVTSARSKYDSYGNPVTLLDPLASAPGGAVAFSKGHARELDYDARFHTYPTTETIHVGDGKDPLVFQAGYDEGFGTVISSTDFNANSTTYGYDPLARLTSTVKPGDSESYPTVEYDYALALPSGSNGLVNYVETRQRDKSEIRNPKSEMYFVSRQFVDGLGRSLMTKTEAEPETDVGPPRVTVKGAALFNARQKPHLVLNPFFSTLPGDLEAQLAFENIESPGWQGRFHEEGSLVTLNLATAHQTATEYDATLRETRTINPDGTFRSIFYEPLLTRTYDENDTDPTSQYSDTPILHRNDGLGRLVQVDEITRLNDDGTPAGDLHTWITRYEYDLNDQLTRITDAQNNVKWFEYDGLRRRIFMNDPDRGIMRWIYDDASNLKETTDAKSQPITYTYDGANRIRTEKHHDGQSAPPWRSDSHGDEALTNSVVYHYDEPFPDLPQGDNTTATTHNLKGMLAWVEDLSGEEHTSYDARGRVEWIVKRIPDPKFLTAATGGAPLVAYKTAFEYDSLDRNTRLVYPDNDEISYVYNDRSLLKAIVGGVNGLAQDGRVVPQIQYAPSGQMLRTDYGNGVRTTHHYDSQLRLTSIQTVSSNATPGRELINFAYEFDGVSNIRSIEDRRPTTAVPQGDLRRNTQLFQYDDLYRLRRVQYSFAPPGVPANNDGEINYRYDRIGNMLAQTSTLTNHVDKGLPVADLGEMVSGGTLGRWNRTGRAASDPPGPHALTAIQHSSFATRHYPYDANGNMTNIDGLVCAWDFKDRLAVVENDQMRATYTYDYTGRRIAKDVSYKPGSANFTNHNSRITTLYINRYFEVREHDAPTKYVWNGNTRVARVTGSLSPNERIQRLRVWPGWNLCSLAVSGSLSASGGEGQSEVISSAYGWNAATHGWDELTTTDILPAGTVFWLKASTNATVTIAGPYSAPTNWTVPAGGDFLPGAGLEAWCWTNSAFNVQPLTLSLWRYDAKKSDWLSWLPRPLELATDLPPFVSPGAAVFVSTEAAVQLEVPDPTRQVRYYHEDHIGSSGCITGAQGELIEEVSYYPFGMRRTQQGPHDEGAVYDFLQKERDRETALCLLEARYYSPTFARFLSTDPIPTRLLKFQAPLASSEPQRLMPYSYGLNNPAAYIDPTGLDPNPLRVAANVAKEVGMFTLGVVTSTPEVGSASLLGVATSVTGTLMEASGAPKVATESVQVASDLISVQQGAAALAAAPGANAAVLPGVAQVAAAGAGGYAAGSLLNKASDWQIENKVLSTGNPVVDMLTYSKLAVGAAVERASMLDRRIVRRGDRTTVERGQLRREFKRAVGRTWKAVVDFFQTEQQQRQSFEREEEESGNAAGPRG